MANIEVPFAMQSGQSAVPQNSRERLINMYAEIETSGRKRLIRRQRVGVEAVYTVAGEARAIERLGALHYIVKGSTFYSFDGVTLTTLGTLTTSSGRCGIIFDGTDDILVSDGTTAYHYNGTTLTALTTPQDVGTVAYQGGFGILAVPDSGRFYTTATGNLSSVDALDFATAESYPDNVVRVFVDHNEVWLFGVRSTEIWQLNGGVDFPFTAVSSAQMERGCKAAYSVVAEDNTVWWLGDDGIIYRAEGYRPVRASTHAIERAIAAVSTDVQADCDAFVYASEGHKFVVFRFPGALTVQVDVATGLWSWCETFGFKDWRLLGSAGHVADFFLTDTGIVRLRRGINTDEGGTMRRAAISAPGYADGNRLAITALYLDAEVGRAEIGKAANVMCRVALDGETFGNELVRSLGETGDYLRRAVWMNLGMGRKPAIEIAVTDDVEFSVMEARAVVRAGAN